MHKYSSQIIRLAIAAMFLWFGINQVLFPTDFMGYLPEFLLNSTHAELFVLLNGVFEIIFGLLLALGILVKTTSLILTIHLLLITISLGYNDIMIRDLALTLVTFSIFLRGADTWSIYKKY